jgi:ankyrin repeat protein
MDARKKELPSCPNLEQYKKQAKDLVRAFKSADPHTLQRVEKSHPHADNLLGPGILKAKFALADAQLIVAREHGFDSWPKFAKCIETLKRENSPASASDELEKFIEAASVPLDAHSTGTLERAEAILAAHPEVAALDIYSAAILGDDAAICRWLALDPQNATAKGGLRGWDALTYLCFSRYLRFDRTRSAAFVRAATALLDAGASASTGYFDPAHEPEPEFESALYGAAGVARDVNLTRLLLARGADANNGEVVYHAPESYDNGVVKVLVESGKLTQDSLATMLLRKHDWHDYEGIKWLLEHGADPNRMTRWNRTALQQAAVHDNSLEIFRALLDHGADPTLPGNEISFATVARRGRGDLLELFVRRGIPVELHGVDHLIAACATNDAATLREIAAREPKRVEELRAEGGKLLSEFAGVENKEGVRCLLDLGVDVNARYPDGDIYWDVAKDSTALHAASWRARHATVKLLIAREALVNVLDGKGRTPLALAVRACVDSYWMHLRSPESVKALLDAGASVEGVKFPSGYAEVDELLRRYAKNNR